MKLFWLLLICLIFVCPFLVQAQWKSDREENGLIGYVKSVREETTEIIFKSGKPIEKNRELQSINTYDISGKKLTYYAYTDEGKVLYGDTYFYGENGKLIETKTEHDKFVYLCDKKTYLYDQNGRLSEELCHLTDKGIIGKTVYRYNSDGKLFEEERFPVVEAKLYFSRHSLKRYKYKSNGELDEVLTFERESNEWKPTKEFFNETKSLFYSTNNRSFTQLKFDTEGKLKYVYTSLGDGKGNPLEIVTYFADGSIKEGYRYEYEYDAQGNSIKEIKHKWITQDGKSFFQPTEVTYRKIEYFGEKEIKEFEAKKPTVKPQENQALQNTDKEEYAVYSMLLEQWIDNKEIKNIVVKRFTKTRSVGDEKPLTIDSFLRPRGEKSPLEQSMVNDFNEKNYRRSSQLLENLFGQKSKIILISEAEFGEMFSEGCDEGWKSFYKKYPNTQGVTTLSRVGFNQEKTQALVYIASSGACFGGSGYLVILQKQFDSWKIVNQQMLWIS